MLANLTIGAAKRLVESVMAAGGNTAQLSAKGPLALSLLERGRTSGANPHPRKAPRNAKKRPRESSRPKRQFLSRRLMMKRVTLARLRNDNG